MDKIKERLNKSVIQIIRKWEDDAKVHSEGIDTAERMKRLKSREFGGWNSR